MPSTPDPAPRPLPSPLLPFAVENLPASLEPASSGEQGLASLAHLLAHRMRTPLTSIQCYAEMLGDALATGEDREMALRIVESTAVLEQMLADLQRYSLRLVPTSYPIDACAVASELAAGFSNERGGVTVDCADGVPAIEADPMLLRQALFILLRNALDTVPVVEQDNELCSVCISVRVDRSPAPFVCFEVSNAGVLDGCTGQVFEPFFTTKAQNLGLGLPIAQRIAKAHGGSIDHQDGEGRVRFTLRMPVVSTRTSATE